MIWALRKAGIWAALFSGILLNTGYLMLGWSTYVYPDQTVALCCLASYMVFFANRTTVWRFPTLLLAGVFAGFACLSKTTGIGFLLFLVGHLSYQRKWRDIGKLLSGVAIGALLTVVVFVVLYNWESLKNVWYQFFKSSISDNMKVIGKPINNYYDQLVSIKYFPFISLFLLAGAYKNRDTKSLLIASWTMLLFLLAIRLGGPPIPSYIYPSYVLASLATALYFGKLFSNSGSKSIVAAFSILFLLLILCGTAYAKVYPQIKQYSYNHNYFQVADVYNEHFNYPVFVRYLYGLGPVMVIAVGAAIEVFQVTKIIPYYFLLVGFILTFFNGGLALKKTTFDRKEAGPYYGLVEIMDSVAPQQYAIYLENVNSVRGDRITWVYRVFFQKKYKRDGKFNSQIVNEPQINADIKILKTIDEVRSYPGNFILTNRREHVAAVKPGFSVVGQYMWEGSLLTFGEWPAK